VKNDRIDSEKIAAVLRSGMLPQAYPYPREMRSTRDLLRTIPGVGIILALTILHKIGDIARFPQVGNFISYDRLVKCAHESAGKRVSSRNNKIGNTHLRSAFGEAPRSLLPHRDRGPMLMIGASPRFLSYIDELRPRALLGSSFPLPRNVS
jgi:transposase